jgi:hypothetical protein
MQTDGGTRPTFPTRSTHGRRERRDPELTKLADDRVPALALTTRGNPARRTGVCEIPWVDVITVTGGSSRLFLTHRHDSLSCPFFIRATSPRLRRTFN